jgi:hypothetical protein
MAVERERPLDASQSTATTYRIAARSAVRAIVGAISIPLLVLAVAGLFIPSATRIRGRVALFVILSLAGWFLALVRLHATGGYCTPRHAMLFAVPVIAAAANGLYLFVELLLTRVRSVVPAGNPKLLRAGLITLCLSSLTAAGQAELVAPINVSSRGYREAGQWVAANTPRASRILDLKGWAAFYSQRAGYTFADVSQAERDQELRWIVTHDAHLAGPWDYCETLRRLIGDRRPIVSFPRDRLPGEARVLIFDLSTSVARKSGAAASELPRVQR